MKLTKNADMDKYRYSAYDIGFHSCSQFSWSDGSRGKNVIFDVDIISSVHVDNKRKNILFLGEDPTQGLDNTTITDTKYLINFKESGKRFILSLHYNVSNSFSFVNALKMYQFKAKDSEIKLYPLCLGNVS